MLTREHNGHSFTFREDGWFNMTKAAQHFGKKLSHFWDSPDTKGYVDEVSKLPEFRGVLTIQAIPGRNGGTWAHPKLAIFFARWLDVRFAVWCDAVIEDILTKKAEVLEHFSLVKSLTVALLDAPCDGPVRL